MNWSVYKWKHPAERVGDRILLDCGKFDDALTAPEVYQRIYSDYTYRDFEIVSEKGELYAPVAKLWWTPKTNTVAKPTAVTMFGADSTRPGIEPEQWYGVAQWRATEREAREDMYRTSDFHSSLRKEGGYSPIVKYKIRVKHFEEKKSENT